MKPHSAKNQFRPHSSYTHFAKTATSFYSNKINNRINNNLPQSNFSTIRTKFPFIDNENEKDNNLARDLNSFLKVSQLTQKNKVKSQFTKTINGYPSPLKNQYQLEYVPKRKIKPDYISFETPKAQTNKLDFSKEKEMFNVTQNKNDSEPHNEKDFFQFRTSSILKYAQNSEYLEKIKKFMDYIGDDKRNISVDLYNKMKSIYDTSSLEFFKKVKKEDVINYDTWKNMITLFYELNVIVLKIFTLVFSELKQEKEKNLKLEKKCFEQENMLNVKESELNEVNEYILKYDLTSKIKQRKKKDNSVKDVKNRFVRKENSYILTIYRLEEEIKDLSTLLEKNKITNTKLKNAENEVENKVKEIDVMRMDYNKEINDLNVKINFYKGEMENLNEKIQDIEKANEELLEKKDEQQKLLIESNAEKSKLRMILNEQEQLINELTTKVEHLENANLEEEDNRQAFIERSDTLQQKDNIAIE